MQKGINYYLETRAVTEQLIREHLNGDLCLGTYPIADGKCILCAFDIDIKKGFPYDDQNFELCWKQTLSLRAKLLEFGIKEDQIAVEFSGRRGYHIWIFFEEPQEAAKVYRFVTAVRKGVNTENPGKINIEAFPKNKQVGARGFGSLIKLPFGIHDVTKKRSHLVNPDGEAIPNDALERIVPIGSEQFGEIYKKINSEIREKKVGSNKHGSGSLHVSEELSIPVAVPGVTSADVELLIQKCSLFARWWNDPVGVPYDIWMGLGSNLCALGQPGIAAWRDFSGRDNVGWDENVS